MPSYWLAAPFCRACIKHPRDDVPRTAPLRSAGWPIRWRLQVTTSGIGDGQAADALPRGGWRLQARRRDGVGWYVGAASVGDVGVPANHGFCPLPRRDIAFFLGFDFWGSSGPSSAHTQQRVRLRGCGESGPIEQRWPGFVVRRAVICESRVNSITGGEISIAGRAM